MSTYSAQELCQFFTVGELMEHLDISVTTAKRYQSGRQSPPKPYVRLLSLIHGKRIMPDNWPESMAFTAGKLSTGMTDKPLTWEQLQQYDWVIGEWYFSLEFARKMGREVQKLRVKLPVDERQVEATTGDGSVLPFCNRGRGPHGWGVRQMRRQ